MLENKHIGCSYCFCRLIILIVVNVKVSSQYNTLVLYVVHTLLFSVTILFIVNSFVSVSTVSFSSDCWFCGTA